MRERLITTSTWPQFERGPTEELRGALNRLYELKNLWSDARGTLEGLLNEPVDLGRATATRIEEAKLIAAIIQQQARVCDLEQAT